VAVSKALTLAGEDDLMAEAGRLRPEVVGREASLLDLADPESDRLVFDIPQVLQRVAHAPPRFE